METTKQASRSVKVMSLIVTVVLFLVIGSLIGRVTQPSTNAWYSLLSKSSLTPPSIVFPIVWSLLYTLLAGMGWFLWWHRSNPVIKKCLVLFVVQMVMNWAWSPLFFNLRLTGVAVFSLVVMVIINLILVTLLSRQGSRIALLLAPYLAWLGFATYLSAYIWLSN